MLDPIVGGILITVLYIAFHARRGYARVVTKPSEKKLRWYRA